MLNTLIFCITQFALCQTLAREAPETLKPPVMADFVDYTYWTTAEIKYLKYGHWDS